MIVRKWNAVPLQINKVLNGGLKEIADNMIGYAVS